MTADYWMNAVDGSFSNPTNWSGGYVPGPSQDAVLNVVGSTFTVTSNENEEAHSVQLASNATLSLTAGTFTADTGTGSGANAGLILVGAGASLAASGVVMNTGTIALAGSAKGKGGATLMLGYSTHSLTLTGGGVIQLGGQGNTIGSAGKGRGALYNLDNTIAGSALIAKRLTLVNEEGGAIDANGASPLNVRGSIVNAGLIEATDSGRFVTKNTFLENSATGVVLAAAGSEVELVYTFVQGGTFESTGSGKIVAEGSEFDGTYVPVIFDANVKMKIGIFAGTIENNGIIALSKNGSSVSRLATFEGDGDIDLGGYSIGGNGSALTLASGMISGHGSVVGDKSAPLQLTLGATAVINANVVDNITIDTYASIINAGTIEATGSGAMVVKDAIINNGTIIAGGDGTLTAKGAVSGNGFAMVSGGTLEFISSFNEAIRFAGSGTLELAKSHKFTNSVTGFSTMGDTTLDLLDVGFVNEGEATFSGTASGGVLTVTDGTHTANINLKGDYLGATFVAASDGQKGTDVVATSPQTPSAAHFVSAMAVITGHGAAAGLIDTHGVNNGRHMMLAAPRLALA